MFVQDDIAADILDHCDRTRSKEARRALEKLVWKPLRKDGLTLSNHCVLAQARDVLSAQECMKSSLNDGSWKCMMCKKVFKNEHYLDKHLARKHPNVRNNGSSVCFADLCGSMLPCVPLSPVALPPVSSASLKLSDKGQVAQIVHESKDHCDDKTLRRRRVEACAATVKDCLRDADGQAQGSVRRKHAERLRWDICEKAIVVDCVPREEVWERLGGPSDVLKLQSHNGLWFTIACVIVTLISALLIIFAGMSGGRSSSTRASRRKPRKQE